MLRNLRAALRFRHFEFDSELRRLSRAACTDDLRRIAQKRLPQGVFDYIDGAAEDESALARNQAAFEKIELRPRVLRDVSSIKTETTLLGRPLSYPLVLAPTGFTRIAHSEGELAAARASEKAGLPYTLSTLGTRSIEEVAAVSKGRKWFQVYVWRDRGLVKEMLDRAASHQYEAIMITLDTPVLGRRERDIRNGFTLPPQMGLDTLLSGLTHPGWAWDFLRADPISFANVDGSSEGGNKNPIVLADYINSQFDPALSWQDVEWFQQHWKGPIILKGIQSVADARLAAGSGVQAIALSNHGGRQLDQGPAIAELVSPVADAVGGDIEIICDGGIRRGSDILKAVALGARACMMGRPYLYALGAGGQRGIEFLLEHLHDGVRQTMALVGSSDIHNLDPDLVYRRDSETRPA
ncbi:MAG: alpha-hydroxy acid oxidase [Myxococcota bacterium]|nr:alpha-hydroxy acid oxidase [Myxococcota bacterium]